MIPSIDVYSTPVRIQLTLIFCLQSVPILRSAWYNILLSGDRGNQFASMALGFRQAHGIDRYTKICDIAYGKNTIEKLDESCA